MNREEKLLTEICRAFLYQQDVELDRDVDFRQLFNLAKHHNLLGACHCVLNKQKYREQLPTGFKNAMEGRFLDYVYIYHQQNRIFEEIKELLCENEIRHIFFKGAVIRELYPVAEARAMGDIDVLIEQKSRDTVKELLTKCGFDCTEENGPVYNYRKDGVLVEVHTRIISEFGDDAFCDAFDNAEFHGFTGVLNDDYHLAYLVAHIAHHFKFYGAGIRHILDLAVILNCRDINLNAVLKILKDINLETFGKVVITVCHRWFGVGEEYIDNVESTCDYLCRCGVFGSMQENKGAVVSRREMEDKGDMSPFMIKLRLAFPPYKKLKNINYIRFIDGRPWLTPYAWIYRFFYNVKNRRAFLKSALNEIGDENTKDTALSELNYFKEIGL